MTGMIEILRDEHRRMEELLLVLEQELSVFDRAERPDYEVMRAVVDYFQAYPDRCHHPKESLIFARLKARDPRAATMIGDLATEHEQAADRLRQLALTVESILTDHELPRQAFDKVVHDFIDSHRRNIEMEERVLYPAALNALRPDDWAAITAALYQPDDLLPSALIEAKFNALRWHILKWEQDNEAER